MVASEVGALLGWRLHSSKVNLALTLALTSLAAGILASRLPAVFLLAAVNGLMGGLLLFSGFLRLPRVVRSVSGAGFGLFLAALPYLSTQFGGGLIAGIIFISVLALLNVRHAVIVLCVLLGCVCGALGHLLGSLLGGDGSSWSLVLGILGGLAGLGASLLVFVFSPPLPPLFKGGKTTACDFFLPPLKKGGRGGNETASQAAFLPHVNKLQSLAQHLVHALLQAGVFGP